MDAIEEFNEKLAILINESKLPGPIVKLTLQNVILQLQVIGLKETIQNLTRTAEKGAE